MRQGWAVALLALSLSTAAHAQGTGAPEPPEITPLRYTEDYSYLSDPAKRSGVWWERFKFIPLNRTGSSYVSVGEDALSGHERYWNNVFSPPEKQVEDYFRVRTSPHADLHLGTDFRLFGQLIGAWANRSLLTATPGADETGLDLLQAFIEWHPVQKEQDEGLTLRVGRQMMRYGSERLISPGRIVRRTFDGALAHLKGGDLQLDSFFVWPVKNEFDSFNDSTDYSRKLWSLYSTRTLPRFEPPSGIDLFYIGYENAMAVFHQGEGRELRHTLGARFFGSGGPWEWNSEAHFQFGSFADGNIRAWSVATANTFTFENARLKPSIELRANAISGDRDARDRTLGTFNAMFPAVRYFGENALLGPANLLNLRPILSLDLGNKWLLTPSAVFYWRESLDDGIYGPGLNPIPSFRESRARYVGTQAEVGSVNVKGTRRDRANGTHPS